MQTQSGTDAVGSEGSGARVDAPDGAGASPVLPGWARTARRTARRALSMLRISLLSVEMLLWAAFFVVATCFLALRYWVLPNVERYRADIVAAVSQAVGLPVSVESISADWRGLRPRLELVNVRVFDTGGREALLLPSVVNVIAWRSALFLDLRLHSFEVDDLKLSVRRDAAGRITVGGILLASDEGGGRLSDWVLRQREIVIRNAEIEWIDDQRSAPPLRLSALDLRLQNSHDEHAIGLSARPPRELGSALEVRAELLGRTVKQPRAWSGRVYAEVGNTDLTAWRAWLDYPLDVRSGEGALRVWATLVQGKLLRVAADLALAKVVARLGADLPLLEVAGLQGRLYGRNTPTGFEFGTRDLRFTAPHGPQMHSTSLRLVVDHPSGGAAMKGSFTADLLEFAPLTHVAEALPLPAELRSLLGELAPQGSIADPKFDWKGELPHPASYAARGRFSGLAMKPRGHLPGFSGLSGSLDATEKKGTLYLAAQDVRIDLPKVFPEPRTRFDSLSGQVSWEPVQRVAAAGAKALVAGTKALAPGTKALAPGSKAPAPGDRAPLHFKLANLAFANADLAGTAFGTYTYDGHGPGEVDLTAQLSRADAKEVHRYMPFVLGARVRAWLDSAIVAGVSNDVRLRLRGDLRDFPFSNPAKGQFQIAAKVTQGILDYAEGWPRIEGIDADLLFERDKLEVVGRKGSVFGAALSGVRVSIPNLAQGMLSISGQAEGPTADFLRFTQQSPVKRMVSGFTDAIQATGRGQLRLKLDLPLAEPAKSKVAGQYQLNANNVLVDARLPQVERATGRIEFSENSIAIRDVRGVLFGGPVTLAGGTRPEGGVLVSARGDATVAGMRNFFDHPWKRFLSGGAPYTASVLAAGGSTRIVFESPLTGVTSELPAPLAKSAHESQPLRVEIAPVEGGDRIGVSLGKFLTAEFQRRSDGEAMTVQRTGVGLNQPARLPERNGLLLAGTLPSLSMDSWLRLFDSADAAAGPSAGQPGVGQSGAGQAGAGAGQGGAAAGQSTTAAAMAPGADAATRSGTGTDSATFDLKLGTLTAFGKQLNAVTLRAGADARGWQANIASTEMTGELNYRGRGRGKLTARLSQFTPPADAPGAKQSGGSGDLPAVDLIAERFNFRGKHLGRVEIVAQPEGANWRIEKIANVTPEAALAGKGLWVTGSNSRTALEFSLDVHDAGAYLERVGYPGAVKGASAKLGGTLHWAGDPLNLDYPSLSGDLAMHATNGQFLEIEPGIGKLVSLMSLQMLPRRIALDFRDVFSKGFAFDRIDGTMHIEKGVMSTQDFKMRGPAAEVDIAGYADLAKETQNLRVKVVPALGDTASTVVGLLNPVAGVATMIAQRLLKNPLGNIFAFQYAITGKWSDPKVDKVATVALETDRSGATP